MTTTPETTTPNFKFFQGTLSESSTLPRITIRRGGLIVITRATVDMVGADVAHVQLAYDAKTGAVGIRAASEDTIGSYRLRTRAFRATNRNRGASRAQPRQTTVDTQGA